LKLSGKQKKMKRLFFDMDGVLVNFESGLEQVLLTNVGKKENFAS